MAEYIEREALMDKFSARSPLLAQIRAYIATEPAADVVPVVHGRWVQEKPNREVRCSLCSDIIGVGDFDLCVEGFNYCPNCGARMDGDSDEG